MIACIDPSSGKTGATGVALFSAAGVLVHAEVVRNPLGTTLEGIRNIARGVDKALDRGSHLGTYGSELTLVAEWPIIRPRAKTNPNFLLGLTAVVGAVAALMPDHAKFVLLPVAWKGTIAADTFIARGLKRLTATELKIADAVKPTSLRHNSDDAILMGLHFFGRLGLKHVYPRD